MGDFNDWLCIEVKKKKEKKKKKKKKKEKKKDKKNKAGKLDGLITTWHVGLHMMKALCFDCVLAGF